MNFAGNFAKVMRVVAPIAICAVLAGCGSSSPVNAGGGAVAGGSSSGVTGSSGGSSSGAGGSSGGSALVLKAVTALPPGESGFFSVAGQAAGLLGGQPGDYGANVDDQRLLYWSFQFKDGQDHKQGTPQTPLPGVQVYFDSYGVPAIYADNVYDLWYGAGNIAAQQRLFLMDGVRRMGEGTLAALAGCGSVQADVQARVLGYTDAEYQQFFNRLPQDAKDAVQGYVAGVNAWLAKISENPTLLPAEYAVLSSTPQPFTVKDILASGVVITRSVAAEGGREFENIITLQLLQQALGASAGSNAFRDLVWEDDPQAVVTVNSPGFTGDDPNAGAGVDSAFAARAAYALSLPQTIWKGDGTGNTPLPGVCTLPVIAAAGKPAAHAAAQRARRARLVGDLVAGLDSWRRSLHGGSFAAAIGASQTRDHGALLISEPQLGYSYPTELYELEVHAGPYNARGASVPGLPVVGIGYGPDVAWGLTTGYSKTVESFIETTCSTAQIKAGSCKANQYFHNGAWQDMSCRSEAVMYRATAMGLPAGPPVLSDTLQVCRTVHGPIVARDDTAGLARSLEYAMFEHETDTIVGIQAWNKATNLSDFEAGVRQVTWNENVTVATRDGDIAYFHPGVFPQRAPGTDLRFPVPGTGAFDDVGTVPFDSMPHAIDPPQGYLANWNTKPAHGWIDGEGFSETSRPGGPGQRVTNLLDQLAAGTDWTFADLMQIEHITGTRDQRARSFLPILAAFTSRNAASLDPTETAALQLLASWDRAQFNPAIDITDPTAHDRPAETIFDALIGALDDQYFGFTKSLVIDPSMAETVYSRETNVGSHLFDMSAMDNVVLRILDPASSGLSLLGDYSQGRTPDQVIKAALDAALASLAQQYDTTNPPAPVDLQKFTRVHPRSQLCSLSGVVGPGSSTIPGTSCVTMPFEDRGTWAQLAGFEMP